LAKRFVKQEGISDDGRLCRAVRADKRRGDLAGVTFESAAAPTGTKKDVMERQSVVGAKPLGVGRQIGGELFFGRVRRSHVLGEKLHLLPHTPADEEVVAIEARGSSLAVENLVADFFLDEAQQLLLRRRAPPSSREPSATLATRSAEMTTFAGASASFLPTRP